MKRFVLLAALFAPCLVKAQKFYVEPADKGAEKVIVDKLLASDYRVTFKQDSADYIIKSNVKRMSMGRARGGIMVVDARSGDLISKSKDLWGAAKLANGYDNPVADVLKKTSGRYLIEMIDKLKK